jgi:hypothetical protein
MDNEDDSRQVVTSRRRQVKAVASVAGVPLTLRRSSLAEPSS